MKRSAPKRRFGRRNRTQKEVIALLRQAQIHDDDSETAHVVGDDVLVKLLDSLGYGEVTAEWRKIRKWYA